MNKNIKRVVAAVIAINAVTSLVPGSFNNLFGDKAYASSDIYLKGISVVDGDPITLSSSKKTYKTAVPNSTDTATIRVTTNDKDDKVTIDGSTPEKSGSKKYVAEVSLEKGDNEIEIVVESEDGDDERTYTLKIDRGGKQSTDSESVFLDTINLSDGDINFDKDVTEYDLDVDEDVSEIKVQAKPEVGSTKVYIEGNKVTDDDKYRKTVRLTKGANAVTIELEDEDDDENTKTYTLNIYRGKNPDSNKNVDTSKFDNSQDEIYLENIKINDGDYKLSPSFNKKITSYSLNVPEDIDSIIVKGETEYDANIVKINGTTADSNNRKRVSLTEGKNEIEVQVNTDCDNDDKDYEKRVYKLTVYRGKTEENSEKENQNSSKNENTAADKNSQNNNTSAKVNQWVNVLGNWQYNDATGNPIKNIWFNDTNTGKTYYLNENGNMVTGWLPYNNCWYYLDQSGARQTGWQQIGGSWYHFTNEGKMQTGWFQDLDGKYYYLYSSGAMASNTSIGGYKLGSNGAWIK